MRWGNIVSTAGSSFHSLASRARFSESLTLEDLRFLSWLRLAKLQLKLVAWFGVIYACARYILDHTSHNFASFEVVRDLLDYGLLGIPTLLLPQIWQLRHSPSAYDAAYIVLAEKLGAALITRNGQLASASATAVLVPGTFLRTHAWLVIVACCQGECSAVR